MPLWLLLLLLLILFTVLVFGLGGRTNRRLPRRAQREDVDEDLLAEAERDIEELDVHTSAEDADDHLSDWGPGAPRTRPR